MAARQDQGLQIALIILIFLFILTAVAAYIGWKSYGESEQRAATLRTQLSEETSAKTSFQTENEEYRQMMGFGPNDNFDSVKAAYEADMKKYGAAIADETRRYYKNVLETVYQELTDTAAREAQSKQDCQELDARYAAREAETNKQIAAFREANKRLEEDNASERNKFKQFQQELETTRKDLQANLDKQRAKLEGDISNRDARIKDLETQVAGLQRDVRDFRAQIPTDTESFEIADGRISWVNQTEGRVWINVGEADSIRRQVTFNVYDADEHDADRAVKKGSIEVTKVIGDHMAEAKITQDDPTNPILTGDNIYSPVWDRGKKLRFALTGIIDLNDDGISDVDLARELIELNGGAVDAYLANDGKVVGDILAHTRYLVLGAEPTSALDTKLQAGYQSMQKQAADLGVETITLEQFINRMGYAPQDRVVRLGKGASAQDFPAAPRNVRDLPEPPPPTTDAEPSQFRPRSFVPSSQRTPY